MTATGVIVAMHPDTTREVADLVLSRLNEKFPGVTFAAVAGATSSVAFQFNTDFYTDSPRPQPDVEGCNTNQKPPKGTP